VRRESDGPTAVKVQSQPLHVDKRRGTGKREGVQTDERKESMVTLTIL
jgi:hypothetical protein